MSELILAIGFVVWLVAAYAFVRAVLALIAVTSRAPEGQKLQSAFALCSLNFPAAASITGESGQPAIQQFRTAAKLFVFCFIPFIGLVLLNILSGNAA